MQVDDTGTIQATFMIPSGTGTSGLYRFDCVTRVLPSGELEFSCDTLVFKVVLKDGKITGTYTHTDNNRFGEAEL